MHSRRTLLALFISFVLLVDVDSFQSFPKQLTGTTCYARAVGLFATKSPKENDNTNGQNLKKSNRKPRTVDYPSFVFKPDGRIGQKLKKSTTTPKFVSVPPPPDPQPSAGSLLSAIFGPLNLELLDIKHLANQTRLLNERSYARPGSFLLENIDRPPSLDDLLPPPRRDPFEGFWISVPARLLSFGVAYAIFPFACKFMYEHVITLHTNTLFQVISSFIPGISVLYGTFISITLSILDARQRKIQENVASECALLTFITRNLLNFLQDDRDRAIDAAQCSADQIRTLVRSSRGTELMLLMYSDPYARMLEIVDEYEQDILDTSKTVRRASTMATCRDTLKDLVKVRAIRLSDEALALPPTHFLILTFLTVLILGSYMVSILPTVNEQGYPSNESSMLFGLLTVVYVLFYNFIRDLNSPFQGVYQVRRSCAAAHLLETKWLIVNHPLLRGEVDFEEVQEEAAGVQIRSPGLGDIWFEREDIYLDKNGDEEEDAEA